MRSFKTVENNKRTTERSDGGLLSSILKTKSNAIKARLHLPLLTSPTLCLITFYLELELFCFNHKEQGVSKLGGANQPLTKRFLSLQALFLFFPTSFMSLTQLTPPTPSQLTSYSYC